MLASMAATSDVVFNPSHAGDRTGPRGRWKGFRAACDDGAVIWSGKTTAKSGDVYLFWFGEPLLFLGGIGIHDGTFHDDSEWKNLGGFEPVLALASPIGIKQIQNDAKLADWWAGSPYRGQPKTILKRPDAAHRLLELIVGKNPSLNSLLSPYMTMLSSTLAKPRPTSKTETNRLTQQLSRLPSNEKQRLYREVLRAERDGRLRPAVLAIWGNACAACGVSLCARDVMWECEVAHVREVSEAGGDDIANAFPLCRTHHWAFDHRLWTIHPKTLRVFVSSAHREESHLSRLHKKPLFAANERGPRGLNRQYLKDRLRQLKAASAASTGTD